MILTLLSFAIALKLQDQNLPNSKETKRLQKNYINESYFLKFQENGLNYHLTSFTVIKFC